ncbi:MAG: chromosome segregation protein SMC [Promethearchaeota archaeon]
MVFIKKIEMKGFKSFGNQKLISHFPRGFTAVVGPNGSGKSNILDAFCFVLGHLSAKTMRAGSFSDLIYSGGDSSPSAKYARVTLYLDNSDGGIPIDSSSVVVARVIDQEGRGAYWLNGKRVTRNQIIDLLGMAGISPNGYNIVLQGQLAQFIQMSPVDRRILIEQVAGIATYDEKKEKALGQLKLAEQNLSKIELLIREVMSELERLEKEKNDAVRWQELSKEIKKSEALVVFNELQNTEQELSGNQILIDEKKKRLDRLEKDGTQLSLEVSKKRERLEEIDAEIRTKQEDELEKVRAEINELNRLVSQMEADFRYLNNRYEEGKENLQKLDHESKEIEDLIQRLHNEIQKLKEQKTAIQSKIAQKDELTSEITQHISQRDTTYSASIVKLRNIRKQLDLKRGELADISTQKSVIEKELSYLYEDRKSLESIHSERSKRVEETIKRKETLEAELNQVRSEIESLEKQKREADEETRLTVKQLRTTEELVRNAREEIIKLKVRINSIREARARFLRSRPAVHEVLELRDNNVVEGIFGTIAELGVVSSEYATALEVAAGARLSYVVVRDDDVAAKCINYLKQKKLGQASFLPLNRLILQTPKEQIRGKGVVAPAIELIRFEGQYKPAFDYVFGRTLIVDDLNTARFLKAGSNLRKVTVDGDVVEPSGLMTGGHYIKPVKITQEDEETLPKVEEQLNGLIKTQLDLRDKRDGLIASIDKVQNELLQKREKQSEITAKLESINLQVLEEEKSLNEILPKMSETQDIVDEKKTSLQTLENQSAKVEKETQELSRLSEELSEIVERSTVAELNEKIKALEKEREQLKDSAANIDVDLTQNQTRLNYHLLPRKDEILSVISKLEEMLPELEKELLAKETELDEQREIFGKFHEEKGRIEGLIGKLQKEKQEIYLGIHEKTNKLSGMEKELMDLRLEINSLEVKGDNYQNRLVDLKSKAQEYILFKPPEIVEIDVRKLGERVRELQEEKMALEPINQKAILRYPTVKERYDELSEKQNRLLIEKNSIVEFMDEIEREKTKVFMSTFNEINRNFNRIFGQLSPGGESRLVLENEMHPFMGGIRIKANPGGKKVLYLEAMSGGEKALTSLALIFAIQRCQPAPFYIFDEVDASLDLANVKRVAELIKEFSKDSQFIVISLQDVMMARADSLLGLVRKRDHSTIVSAKLEQGARYIE